MIDIHGTLILSMSERNTLVTSRHTLMRPNEHESPQPINPEAGQRKWEADVTRRMSSNSGLV